ncbi:MAG: efflux RND transporter periplasmic adaptor subunit [Thermoguttaceae bacterium]
MPISSLLLSAALSMFGTQNMAATASDSSTVVDCLVVAIHDSFVPADLPAQQGGVLRAIHVKVGDQVKKGDALATIDDEMEKLSLEVSKQRLVMAEAEAGNDVNVRYADVAGKVARYKYQTVVEAIAKVPETFSKSEVMTYSLTADQFVLQKEQAEHEQNLAKLSVRVREAEYKLAEQEMTRRQIKAPVDGVIEEVKVYEGDWVRAGDPIVRLVQMDRLKINASLRYGPLSPADVRGKPVVVTVELAHGQVGRFEGRVDSTGSDYGTGEIDLIVEVINQKDPKSGDWLLMPNMKGQMQIQGIGLP